MLRWEIKKILKDKSSIIVLILIVILFVQISFIKPILETQNEYWDENKNEYIVDNRSEEIIGNEKLKTKVDAIKLIASSSENDKTLIDLSSKKLRLDDGQKYEEVNFYKVFTYRLDFTLSIAIMLIIILMIVSNLYTDENISNTASIILSTKNRNKVLFSKLGLSILVPILLYGIYVSYVWLITYIQYGQPANGNLQMYRISDIAILTKALTINQYAISEMTTVMLMLLGISVVSMMVSFFSDNSVKAIVLSAGFIVLGKIFTLFKFLPKSLLVFLSTANYVDITMGMTKISGIYNGKIDLLSKMVDVSNLSIGIYSLVIVFGVLGCLYCIKKFLIK